MPFKDPNRRREYDRERRRRWRKANPDKVKAANKRTRQKLNWNEYAKAWRKTHSADVKAIKRRNLLKRYGLTEQAFADMLESQNHACKICLRPFSSELRPNVDHDHDTGKVRSLLCAGCNGSVGLAKESEFVLARMIAYLRRHKIHPDESWLDTRFTDFPQTQEKPVVQESVS